LGFENQTRSANSTVVRSQFPYSTVVNLSLCQIMKDAMA
jgi:hypothetical protein